MAQVNRVGLWEIFKARIVGEASIISHPGKLRRRTGAHVLSQEEMPLHLTAATGDHRSDALFRGDRHLHLRRVLVAYLTLPLDHAIESGGCRDACGLSLS